MARSIPQVTLLNRRQVLHGIGALSCVPTISCQPTEAADVILYNAKIWTGDAQQAEATALAISGNRILTVGPDDIVNQHAASGTRLIDLQRRFVMPGFNDSHVHMMRLAAASRKVNLLDAKSIADILERVRQRVAETPAGEWVESSAQWHETLLEEGRMPTLTELDKVAPNHPVFLPRGGHVAAVNSVALSRGGITQETPDPPGGIIVRDHYGEPTGLMIETARHMISRLLEPLGPDEFRSALIEQIAEFNRLGITSVTNPSTTPFEVEQLQAIHQRSPLSLRVHWTISASTAEDVHELQAQYAPGEGDNILRFSGLGEVGVDGGVEGAYLREPYELVPGEQDDPEYRGIVPPHARDEEQFVRFYLAAIDAGFNVMTHVTGDAGLDVALKILSMVDNQSSLRGLRWTLHGCFLTDQEQLAKIKDLDLHITAQAQPYLLGHQMVRWWGQERADRSIPLRSFVDAGIKTGGGSDASAGIANPLESLGWMVNRTCLGDLQLAKEWSVTPEEALIMYTRGSAETQFMDKLVGTLRNGMLADLAILAQDPLTVPPEDIYGIENDATVFDGEVVFDRHGLFAE